MYSSLHSNCPCLLEMSTGCKQPKEAGLCTPHVPRPSLAAILDKAPAISASMARVELRKLRFPGQERKGGQVRFWQALGWSVWALMLAASASLALSRPMGIRGFSASS